MFVFLKSNTLKIVVKPPVVNPVQVLRIRWTVTTVLSMFWSRVCPNTSMSFSRCSHRKLETSEGLGWIMSPTPFNHHIKPTGVLLYCAIYLTPLIFNMLCKFNWSLTRLFLMEPWSMARCVSSRRMQDLALVICLSGASDLWWALPNMCPVRVWSATLYTDERSIS